MALRQEVLAGVREIFSGLDDIPVNISYRSIDGTSTYDPATGSLTQTDAAGSPYTVEAVVYDEVSNLVSLNLSGRQGNLEVSPNRRIDKKAIIIQQDLPVVPKDQDLIVIDSITYRIEDFKEDPTESIWLFELIANN